MAGVGTGLDLQDPAYRGFATHQFKAQQKQGLAVAGPSVSDVLDDAREVLREQKSKASRMGLNQRKVSAIRMGLDEDAIDRFELPQGAEGQEQEAGDSPTEHRQAPQIVAPAPMIGKRARRASMFAVDTEQTAADKSGTPGPLPGRKSAGAALQSPTGGTANQANKRFSFLAVSRGVSHCHDNSVTDEYGEPVEDTSTMSFIPTNDQSRAGKQLDMLRTLDSREPKTVRTPRGNGLQHQGSTVSTITPSKSLPASTGTQNSSDLDFITAGNVSPTDPDSRSDTGKTAKPLLPRLQLSQKSLDASLADGGEGTPMSNRTPRSKAGLPITSGLTSFSTRRTGSVVPVGDSTRVIESPRISNPSGMLPSLSTTAPPSPRTHAPVGRQASRATLNINNNQQQHSKAVPQPADGKLAPMSPRMMQAVEPLRTPRSLFGKLKEGFANVFTSVRA